MKSNSLIQTIPLELRRRGDYSIAEITAQNYYSVNHAFTS